MTMELSPHIMDFVQRFQTLEHQRVTSDALIKDLLFYCEDIERNLQQKNQTLVEELRNTRLDYTDATKSRRDLQQQLQVSQVEIDWLRQQNDSLKNRNPYVLILIDGDGVIFKDEWIRQGIEGGKKAAYALRSAVAAKCRNRANDVEIIAKVVANFSGLNRALQRGGHVENANDFKDFTLGFTQAKASFDFIDVGYGKERADSKIKELTTWNLRNENCKQVLLGISHDAGYAPFLDEVLRDETTRKRVALIEGVHTVNELAATDVAILDLGETLFRREKIIDRSNSVPSTSTASSSPTVSTSSITTAPTPVSSYAGVATSASPPPQITLPFTLKPAKVKKPEKPVWNPGPRGIDEPISVSQHVLDSIKSRKDSQKLCNNHFLRGPCSKADICNFVHNYKPSSEEIKAIAVLTRQNPCTAGQDCENEDCIYGHHCPSVKAGLCTHPYCKFPEELHPPGTKYKNAYVSRN